MERLIERCAQLLHGDTKARLKLAAAVIAPLTLLALAVRVCTMPLPPASQQIYLLVDGTSIQTVDGTPDFTFESEELYIRDLSANADAQLVLAKGQEVEISVSGGAGSKADDGAVELRAESGRSTGTATVKTRHETVANLLRRCRVNVSEEQMVVVDVTDGTPRITVCDQYQTLEDKPATTDFAVEYVENPLLDKGTEQVVQEGVPGKVTETYLNTYSKGQLAATELVSVTADNSVTQIVEYGSRVTSVDRSDYVVDVVYNENGGGYLRFASGDTMTFSGVATSCEATAYSIHGGTASGRPTAYGNIAVDPSVFPYGTQLYIYSNDGYIEYGMATAADCGSGITGYDLDLWFDEFSQACAFGRRYCTAFILD